MSDIGAKVDANVGANDGCPTDRVPVYLREASRRVSARVERALGRRPQHYWSLMDKRGGVHIRLDDAAEVATALAAGAVMCRRRQNPRSYRMCW